MAEGKCEAAIRALEGQLSTAKVATKIERSDPNFERIPAGGYLQVRDGDRGTPEFLLGSDDSPYLFAHLAELLVFTKEQSQADRNRVSDAILQAAAAAIEADETLAGAVIFARAQAPEEPEDEAIEGGPGIKALRLPVLMHYQAPTAVG